MLKLNLLAIALVATPILVVQAQETQAEPEAPFFEYPTELRHAYALDLVGLQLDILALDLPEDDDADAEAAAGEDEADAEAEEGEEGEGEEEGLLETALPLLAGSLAAADEVLLAELETAVAAIEIGDEAATEDVRTLITEIESTLIPEDLSSDVAFRAARLALLSSLEPGVGEGYEEAAQGETEAYYIGYTGLQKVKAMWADLEPELAGDQGAVKENIVRAFGVIDGLMPSPELPARFSDPEDAEVAVNDVVFGLEALTGTALIPRDFGGMLSEIETHVAEGCSAAEAGNTALALEWTTAANFFYGAYLSDTLGMLAPDANARIDEELGELVEEPESDQTASRCENIGTAISEASSVFGG